MSRILKQVFLIFPHFCLGRYDTGGSLYEDCGNAGLPVRETDIYEYVEHFGGASYANVPAAERAALWLKEHRNLYE